MKKNIIFFIGIFIFSFLLGTYMYKINSLENSSENVIIGITDECTQIAKAEENKKVTAKAETKISPNCKLIKEKKYLKCGHVVRSVEEIDEKMVNLNEEKFKIENDEWQIKKFTENEVIIYKEINEQCNEHFVLRNEEGSICLYRTNENNQEEFIKDTEISSQYLTQTDLIELNKGVRIYSKEKLNKRIEDLE